LPVDRRPSAVQPQENRGIPISLGILKAIGMVALFMWTAAGVTTVAILTCPTLPCRYRQFGELYRVVGAIWRDAKSQCSRVYWKSSERLRLDYEAKQLAQAMTSRYASWQSQTCNRKSLFLAKITPRPCAPSSPERRHLHHADLLLTNDADESVRSVLATKIAALAPG
jgi:hypothetical protein